MRSRRLQPGDKVTILSGEYKGQTGFVIEHSEGFSPVNHPTCFFVEIPNDPSTAYDNLWENDLRLQH